MESWPLWLAIMLFVAGALTVTLAGMRMTVVADKLADRLGWGEAFVGAVFLGASTSLADASITLIASIREMPVLAMSNAIGGIAAQTAFIPLVDLTYRRVNLEHAAASLPNMISVALLGALLALALAAPFTPGVALLGLHPVSFLLIAGYVYGMHLVQRVRMEPMWTATATRETREDVPDSKEKAQKPGPLLLRFIPLAALMLAAGWALTRSAGAIVEQTGLSQGFVGAAFTGVASSLPEWVTSLYAVRRGALTLAVGGIVGGNTFDVLLLVLAYAAYRPGSVYHVMESGQAFFMALTVVMTLALLLGLLRRQAKGPVNIGFEGVAILALYVAGLINLALRAG